MAVLFLFAALSAQMAFAGDEAGVAAARKQFKTPPDDARIMMRWWWFGAAVKQDELARELDAMKAAGIGGVELQPVYPLALDDPQKDFRNLPFLSPGYLDSVRFASQKAQSLGLRIALTLGSGWPYGGPTVPVSEASSRLRIVLEHAAAGEHSFPRPAIGNGEELLAVFGTPGEVKDAAATRWVPLPSPQGARLTPAPDSNTGTALFFIASRTGQMVKRPAVGAEGFVLDHFSKPAVADHLKTVAGPLLDAFGDTPPSSVFSDSLEVYGADWTPNLLAEFRARRGYDLTPLLPELVYGHDQQSADLRYDWALTLNELIDENYLTAIDAWATARHTHFRSQTYGIPAVTLSSNARVELPEGEGSQWHSFSTTRWATSASHLYGRPVTSAETWTWVHSPPFRATPLDLKAEADTFFLQGVNQLVGHGWPYSPPQVAEPGWNFYAAGALNAHNPWWIVMPYLTSYLQRVSYLLRQGSPANQIAVLLPEEDAMAQFSPGHTSVSEQMNTLLGPELVPQILDAGFGFDFVDSEAIVKQGIHASALVMPPMDRLPLAAYQRVVEYLRKGGIVVTVSHAPSIAPGVVEDKRDSEMVRAISSQLFDSNAGNARMVDNANKLGETLISLLHPDLVLDSMTPQIGFIHRKLQDGDIYFIANTDNLPHKVRATFSARGKHLESWDPLSGEARAMTRGSSIQLDLAPYESRILVLSDEAPAGAGVPVDAVSTLPPVDLSTGWSVTFGQEGGKPEDLTAFHSWTDDKATRYYSGTATYEKTVSIAPELLSSTFLFLDFGQGTPVPRTALHQAGMQAWLEGPVREAALVYVNGTLAGAVWKPPYSLDLKPLLKAGENQLKIVVANTAINELAGRALPDYRLLNDRYGERFVPQDMKDLKPIPSGILVPLKLVPTGVAPAKKSSTRRHAGG